MKEAFREVITELSHISTQSFSMSDSMNNQQQFPFCV